MKLREYLDLEPGNGQRLAGLLNCNYAFLWMMAAGTRSVSPRNAVAIELYTDRQVSREDLREDWWAIWPEIRGRRRPASRLPPATPPPTAPVATA